MKGYRSLEKEIHIETMLKKIRVMKGVMKKQLGLAQWTVEKHRYSIKDIKYDAKSP